MDFGGDVDEADDKPIEVEQPLEVSSLLEKSSQSLLADFMVVLRFALELDQLEQIKVAAEVHKAGEVESLE